MNRRDIARLHKMLRHAAQLTQAELGRSAGIGRGKVIALEAGRLEELQIGELDRSLAVLDARLVLSVAHHGAHADRMLDAHHAALVDRVVRVLRALGWEVKVEVTFNDYGDRGSFDVIAWHPAHRALLVIEVKSELASVEGTLRPFAVKCRVARKIVAEQFGWRPVVAGCVLVLPEASTARRSVQRHAAVFDAALPGRSRDVRAWLRKPAGPLAAVWFLSNVRPADLKRSPSAIQRVRSSQARSGIPSPGNP